MSEHKLQEALDCICSAKLCSINSMSSRVEMLRLMDLAIDKLREVMTTPSGEQVGLTDVEVRAAFAKAANPNLMWPETVVAIGRAIIAAHEAKKGATK